MSDMTGCERRKLEKLLSIDSSYALNFSYRICETNAALLPAMLEQVFAERG